MYQIKQYLNTSAFYNHDHNGKKNIYKVPN